MEISKKTLNYYNSKAESFVTGTVSVDFEDTQKRFLNKLSKGTYILDFGCGSGRDTRYFLQQGYRVHAIDGSAKLCRMASEYTGISVQQMLFQDLDETDCYDGIWACASILHLPKQELSDVLRKMISALKENGVIYTAFKYGTFEGERGERYFTDFTEDTFADFIEEFKELKTEECWLTSDVRVNRGEEKWLNLILRKI